MLIKLASVRVNFTNCISQSANLKALILLQYSISTTKSCPNLQYTQLENTLNFYTVCSVSSAFIYWCAKFARKMMVNLTPGVKRKWNFHLPSGGRKSNLEKHLSSTLSKNLPYIFSRNWIYHTNLFVLSFLWQMIEAS